MSRHATIEVDQFLPHSPSRVWCALTDSKLLAHWLMPNNFEPRVGHRFTLDTGNWGTTECEVLTLEPEKLLRISWRNGALDTVVTWRLAQEGRGTRLIVEQAGFDLDQPLQQSAFDAMNEGWRGPIAQRLADVLDTDHPYGAQ
jgi:uncharacterized protein YndB with AHSA1/START domain